MTFQPRSFHNAYGRASNSLGIANRIAEYSCDTGHRLKLSESFSGGGNARPREHGETIRSLPNRMYRAPDNHLMTS